MIKFLGIKHLSLASNNKNMKKNIPNTVTCLNLISGCIGCVFAFNDNFLWAFIFVVIAAIFDFFDGFTARALKSYSSIGKELDSLADVISFGLTPGAILYNYLDGIVSSCEKYSACICFQYLPYIAFLITVFSALRLAKFNVDERQTNSFIGLPVPADALFWCSSVLYLSNLNVDVTIALPFIIVGIGVFSYLMVSELPMFSIKFKSYSWKGNEAGYILIMIAAVLFALFEISLGVSFTILTYILMSLIIKKK